MTLNRKLNTATKFSDHEYSSAEFIPETFSYTGSTGPLDLTIYFIYMGSVIIFIYVSILFEFFDHFKTLIGICVLISVDSD